MMSNRHVQASLSTASAPFPHQVANVAEQYHSHNNNEQAESKFSSLPSRRKWKATAPELPPSIEPKVIRSIIGLDFVAAS